MSRTLLVSLMLCACAAQAAAQAPASGAAAPAREHFAAGETAFAEQDYLRALAAFQAAVESGSDGPAVYYNIAVCHYRLGDYVRAEDGFRRLAERFPQMRNLADYNLGLALTRQERAAEARVAFERARNGNDGQVAALAAAMLERIALAPAAVLPTVSQAAWTRLLDLRIGHDDNVALIDAAGLPAGRSIDSPFSEIFAYVRGPADRGWRLDASAHLVTYPDASEFNQAVIHLAGMYGWRVGRWRLDAGPHYGHATLDGDGFERRVGGSVHASRAFGAGLTFGVDWVHDEIDELEPQFAFVAGHRDQFRLVFAKTLAAGRLVLEHQIEQSDRAVAGVSADRERYALRYRRYLSAAWTVELQVEHRDSDYAQLAVPREETRSQLGVLVLRDLARGWQLGAQYRYADNDSTDSVYSYERHRVAIGLSKVF